MAEPTVLCPQCKTQIKLTESLAAPLVESLRVQYEQRLAQKDADIHKREEALREQQTAIAAARESLDEQVAAKLKAGRSAIAQEEAKKVRLELALDMEQRAKEVADLQLVLQQRDAKLAEAQKAQVDLIRKQRELDDAKRELDLTVEKRVQGSLDAMRAQARKEAEDELNLKVMEKEQKIIAMQRQIEVLKQKAEQGSQQTQGEVLELTLETMLRDKFPHDDVTAVSKGEYGADVLQAVLTASGKACGRILWESKRTKTWSPGWLAKLRDDQRAAKADIAVMVSIARPKDVDTFSLVDDVWICSPQCALPVAIVLRHSLIELAAARSAGEGQQSKMELMYAYLTGPRFRQRVQAIVEKFGDMQEDLNKERKSLTKLWAKREQQILGVLDATAGMYGDLQGIAGKSLQEIEGLEIPLLEWDGRAPVDD